MREVDKKWGKEYIYFEQPEYIVKMFEVNEGELLSLQYHNYKKESMHCLEGDGYFYERMLYESPESLRKYPIFPGWSRTIEPLTVHRVEAVTPLKILEASTFHTKHFPDDIVRLEDKYGRSKTDISEYK